MTQINERTRRRDKDAVTYAIAQEATNSIAQTLANLKMFADERFAREVLNRPHALGEVNQEIFNVLGGSIAYGHPFAATGARMITQTLNELRRRGGGLGLVTACAAGGLGAAMVLEAE